MSMEIVQIILTTGIFLTVLLAFLLSVIKAMLNASINPLKKKSEDINLLKEDVFTIKQAVLNEK